MSEGFATPPMCGVLGVGASSIVFRNFFPQVTMSGGTLCLADDEVVVYPNEVVDTPHGKRLGVLMCASRGVIPSRVPWDVRLAAAEAEACDEDKVAKADEALAQGADPVHGGAAAQDSAKQAGKVGCSGPANTVGKLPVENKKVDRRKNVPSKATVREPAKKVRGDSCKKRPHQRPKSKKEQRETQARRTKRYRSGCHLDSEESLTLSDGDHPDAASSAQ